MGIRETIKSPENLLLQIFKGIFYYMPVCAAISPMPPKSRQLLLPDTDKKTLVFLFSLRILYLLCISALYANQSTSASVPIPFQSLLLLHFLQSVCVQYEIHF